MKRVLKNRTYFALICGFVFFACKKKEDAPKENHCYEVSKKLESYFFDIGSYWIYKNTKTEQIDSTYVLNWVKNKIIIGPGGPGEGSSGEQEFFELTFGSSMTPQFKEQLVFDFISKQTYYGGLLYVASRAVGDERNNAKILDIHDSLLIGNKMYTEVVEMKIVKDNYVPIEMNLFYKDSIGLLKKVLFEQNDTTTYELINHNVSFFQR